MNLSGIREVFAPERQIDATLRHSWELVHSDFGLTLRLTSRRGGGRRRARRMVDLSRRAERKVRAAVRCRRLVMRVLLDENSGQLYLRPPLPPVLGFWQPARRPRST